MFTKKFGVGRCHPNTLSHAVARFSAQAGHPELTLRSLRHFHASVTLQAGQNVVVISKRLGHSKVSITSDIYAHSLPGWQRAAAQAFAETMKEFADTEAAVGGQNGGQNGGLMHDTIHYQTSPNRRFKYEILPIYVVQYSL